MRVSSNHYFGIAKLYFGAAQQRCAPGVCTTDRGVPE
jgi:hypothetical protein